jgi:hypothetical protein
LVGTSISIHPAAAPLERAVDISTYVSSQAS